MWWRFCSEILITVAIVLAFVSCGLLYTVLVIW